MTDTLQHTSVLMIVAALALAFVASLAGGAVGGIYTGGKVLGNELAAMLGGLYGPLAGVTGVAIAFLILALVG